MADVSARESAGGGGRESSTAHSGEVGGSAARVDLAAFDGYTPGEWRAFNMVQAERGGPMTPEEIGEYVANSVRKSIDGGGSPDRFLFVSTECEGAPDICHVGNGPMGPANAHLIAAAPTLLAEIRALRAENEALRETLRYIADEKSGWRFRVDPLEHARSVIEEMRDMASRALHPASEDPAGPATPGEETT